MSSPLPHLPSRPERARVKHSENIALGATGFQAALQSGPKKSKKRARQRAMHGVLPESSLPMPPKSPEDPIFTYFQKESEKDGASCVFLLWGSEKSESFTTWAVDVAVTDVESEQDIFDSLAKRYYKELGLLRRCLSFRKFSRVKPVTFRLICRSFEKFQVFVEPLDLDNLHKSYSEQKENAMNIIDTITDFTHIDFQDHCYRDSSGQYNHNNVYCPTNSSELHDISNCPYQEWDKCNDQIRWIQTASFLSCYFRNPSGASSQKILSGLITHHFIHYYRNICFPVNEFRPQNRYLELEGLYVETKWCPRKCLCVFLSILLSVVIGGKLFWGSWEVIFGAGSFIVGLLMLVLTALDCYDV